MNRICAVNGDQKKRWRSSTTIVLAMLLASSAYAQWGGRRERRVPDRSEFPTWEIAYGFDHDVFTFARIRYTSRYGGRGNRWSNDFPDSDWNYSYRLQQLTSMAVDPNGKVLELTDAALYDYPFIYMR